LILFELLYINIPVGIGFSIILIFEEDNICGFSLTDDEICSIVSSLCLSLRYKCSVSNDVVIVVNNNIVVEYERPLCRIPLKENIDLNEMNENDQCGNEKKRNL